jgi:hypothetical protein
MHYPVTVVNPPLNPIQATNNQTLTVMVVVVIVTVFLVATLVCRQVRLAEDASQAKKERYAAATRWEVLPCLPRHLLKLAVFLMVVACYMVQLLECFVPYELTSRPRDLPGSMWYNLIIYPTGVLACFFFLASCFVFYLYNKWAGCRAASWPMPGDEQLLKGQEEGQQQGGPAAAAAAAPPAP